MDLSQPCPDLIAIAGDWGGNVSWACHVIEQAAALLPQDGPRIIVQLGDYGLLPWQGDRNSIAVEKELSRHRMAMWFLDGNHEWHNDLDVLHETQPGPAEIWPGASVVHLPRGTRWNWHGRRWLAVGGAGSPDWKLKSRQGKWFAQEVLSQEQADAVIADGSADILLAHDCPSTLMPQMPEPPSFWDMSKCHESSARLQRVTDAVQPSRIFHGHLHLYRDEIRDGYHVTGLSNDGGPLNWGILDVRTLKLSIPSASVRG
jgi:hypothetical protein